MCRGAINAFTLPFVFYLQISLGLSAFGAGINLLAFSLGSVVTTGVVVPLVSRFGNYLFTAGAILMIVGIMWTFHVVSISGDSFTAAAAIAPMGLAGAGLSGVVIPLVDVSLATVSVDDSGAAAGARTTFQQLGAATGVAVSTTVFFGVLGDDWFTGNALAAFRASTTVAVVGLLIVAVVSLVLPAVRRADAGHRAPAAV